jgi:hypothetical protein
VSLLTRRGTRLSGGELRSAEDEALQTDVMRFMAVLGLCLMVIFALVQSLPTVPPDSRPRLDDPERLRQEIADLGLRADALRREIAALVQLRARLHALRGVERVRLQGLHEEVAVTRAQRVRNKRALERLARNLERRRGLLTQLDDAVRERRESLARLSRQVELIRRDLDRDERQARGLRQRIGAATPEPAPAPPTPVPGSPERVGFRLRFADESALSSLVASAEVGFYAIVGDAVRQARLTPTTGLVFRPAERPQRYHEMAPETVPRSFVRALRRQIAVLDPTSVTWGVTLPDGMRGRIQGLMERRRGGDLVIDDRGRVRLE